MASVIFWPHALQNSEFSIRPSCISGCNINGELNNWHKNSNAVPFSIWTQGFDESDGFRHIKQNSGVSSAFLNSIEMLESVGLINLRSIFLEKLQNYGQLCQLVTVTVEVEKSNRLYFCIDTFPATAFLSMAALLNTLLKYEVHTRKNNSIICT